VLAKDDKYVGRSVREDERGREQHPEGQPHGIFELVTPAVNRRAKRSGDDAIFV